MCSPHSGLQLWMPSVSTTIPSFHWPCNGNVWQSCIENGLSGSLDSQFHCPINCGGSARILEDLNEALDFSEQQGKRYKSTHDAGSQIQEQQPLPLYLDINDTRKLSVWPEGSSHLKSLWALKGQLATYYFPLFYVQLRKRQNSSAS